MKINSMEVGELKTNCYLIQSKDGLIIIDPGDEAAKIKEIIGNKKVKAILITHYHFDHIGALEELKEYYHVDVNNFLRIEDLQVIETPGHTKDSLTFYFSKDKVMFCGDFLFKDSFGRTDLPTGDNQDMLKSLEKMELYPDDITLYPGHGLKTTLGKEKLNFAYYKEYLKKY